MTARLALGIALTLAFVPTARAQVPSPALWRARQDPAAETDPARTEAAEAFEAGEAAFEAGDYDAAIGHFSHAQALVPHAHTAYNLGLAQARAGRVLEAWATFSALHEDAVDPQRRLEAELQLARLAPSVARVEVRAPRGQVVRIEGANVEPNTVITRAPGPVHVDVGDQALDVDLGGGELRVLDVRTLERPPAPPGPRRGRVGVLVATVALGAATTGTATAAALLGPEQPGRPLGFTAAGLGGATVAMAVTALSLHVRDRRAARRASLRSAR